MKVLAVIAVLVALAYGALSLPALTTAASSIEYAYTGVR